MTTSRLIAGRYRLDTEIGRGSMGTVWNAHDEILRRRVAIKEVNFPAGIPAAEADVLADRTLREARAIAALSHPHVITLFDILTLAGGPVIVMELMIARSLAEILTAHGPLPVRDAATIGRAVASGLVAAHGAGITHRDVKPANVLIADDGRIKLTDFGIARAAGEQTLTATGMLLGSPAYISPEVAAGRPATPSADAWGLGALLFAAVEGRPPFDRGTPMATLGAVVSDPVPAHPHAGELGPVIDGLLAKDPGRRMPVGQAEVELARISGGAIYLPPAAPEAVRNTVDEGGAVAAEAASDVSPSVSASGPGPAAAPRRPPASRLTAPGGYRSSPSLPPPPWSAEAAATLGRLPAVAPAPSRRWTGWVAAAVVLLAAAAGFIAVLTIGRLA
jgi:serine/threonine protein kinase